MIIDITIRRDDYATTVTGIAARSTRSADFGRKTIAGGAEPFAGFLAVWGVIGAVCANEVETAYRASQPPEARLHGKPLAWSDDDDAEAQAGIDWAETVEASCFGGTW